MSKRTYTKPTFFKNEDRLFAEFADGSLYGVIVRATRLGPRLQFIRINP